MQVPQRGFQQSEFENRTARAQVMMSELNIDSMLLTTESNVRYFSGFFTQFWLSPTRPWFLLVPLEGKPIAVIPTIGVVGMLDTWIDDVRSWTSPQPDDDGISLLTSTIQELPARYGRIGISLGPESHLRMPAQDFQTLRDRLGATEICDCSRLLLELSSIKSDAEVEKIKFVCELTSDSFNALPGFASVGDTEREIVQAMRIDLLNRGADNTPYIVAASGLTAMTISLWDRPIANSIKVIYSLSIPALHSMAIIAISTVILRLVMLRMEPDKLMRPYLKLPTLVLRRPNRGPPPVISGARCGQYSKPVVQRGTISVVWVTVSASS
ncbi:hypothetical protein MnTg03_00032 [bacterium MnTg03]|nr:hypothetical protein MnTg03_00032 [bacterium MnTg03]